MLRKFTEGLIFGGGFAISFVAIWYFAAYFITPTFTKSYIASQAPETISDTKKANIVQEAHESQAYKEYSFFKSVGQEQEIPLNGGVLFMAKLPTKPDSIKPYTVQLWLSEKELWLIKTADGKPEIKAMPYPQTNPKDECFNILHKFSGFQSGASSTTISEQTISMLKQGFATERDSMNGKLRITEEGIVFLEPNDYNG